VTAAIVSGHETGTATATTIVPPGSLNRARVVAFYGGDEHYLASWSLASSVVASSSLAVLPALLSLRPNEQATFAASGGVAPEAWVIGTDSTCDVNFNCAQIESITATSAVLQAGPVDGTTVISAIDADGAEVSVTIIVSGAPIDGGPLPPQWDGSFPQDASDASLEAEGGDAAGITDAEADALADATTPDASVPAPDASARDSGGPADAALIEDAAAPRSRTGGLRPRDRSVSVPRWAPAATWQTARGAASFGDAD
jgi:hypothetical protein